LTHKKLQVHVIKIKEHLLDQEISKKEDQFDPQISVSTLTGVANSQTMRVTVLHILLDSGSTRNFLDIQIAKKFGYLIEANYS